jgi:hypothetical protein
MNRPQPLDLARVIAGCRGHRRSRVPAAFAVGGGSSADACTVGPDDRLLDIGWSAHRSTLDSARAVGGAATQDWRWVLCVFLVAAAAAE